MTLYKVSFYINFDIEVEEENDESAAEKAVAIFYEDALAYIDIYHGDVAVHEVEE